ncbi:MAG: hypothetical protein MUC94_14070 [bacterium]|jgi:hypothetical protein|nr:hypothetical protein [bacterium]
MAVVNSASALGEAIGKLIEDEIEKTLKPVCEKDGYVFDRGGARPEKRSGLKLSMLNKSGNAYQLDAVIENSDGSPIVILESKYLRYKKHNRDKASWTCSAHYSLRKSYPTIRKSIAVISGNWSLPSKKFMESFGIELYEIPFKYMGETLADYGVEFNWPEKDRIISDTSWKKFLTLSNENRVEIRERLLSPIRKSLIDSIKMTLESSEDWAKRLNEIELLLKTDMNEYFTYSFHSIKDTIQFLLGLQIDAPDISRKL